MADRITLDKLPEGLKDQFKGYCYSRGKDMKSVLLAYIIELLEEDKKKKK